MVRDAIDSKKRQFLRIHVPFPFRFFAQLLVHNSGDLPGANSTIQPLYIFAQQETAAGRPVNVEQNARVLPSYFSLFPNPPEEVNEGAGLASISGSRLLPLSVFQSSGAGLIDVFGRAPRNKLYPGITMQLGKCVFQSQSSF